MLYLTFSLFPLLSFWSCVPLTGPIVRGSVFMRVDDQEENAEM